LYLAYTCDVPGGWFPPVLAATGRCAAGLWPEGVAVLHLGAVAGLARDTALAALVRGGQAGERG